MPCLPEALEWNTCWLCLTCPLKCPHLPETDRGRCKSCCCNCKSAWGTPYLHRLRHSQLCEAQRLWIHAYEMWFLIICDAQQIQVLRWGLWKLDFVGDLHNWRRVDWSWSVQFLRRFLYRSSHSILFHRATATAHSYNNYSVRFKNYRKLILCINSNKLRPYLNRTVC